MEPPLRPAPAAYEDLARLMNLPLVKPELTSGQVFEGLEIAKRHSMGVAMVRACDIDLAVRTLEGSAVRPGAVAGFPHGTSGTAVKLYEIRDLLRRGAKDIGMVAAGSKLLSREFPYVQTELLQASEACHKEGAELTLILDAAWLTEEAKIVACRCAERAEVDVVASGPTLADVALLRKHLPEETSVAAWGEIETLDGVLELHAAGCTRFVTGTAATILEGWKARMQKDEPAGATTPDILTPNS